MTRLFLIRHGNTVDEDTVKVYKGKTDIPLSRTGVLRMHGAAAFLSTFTLDRIYTSTLSRSIDSGRIIAAGRGIDIEVASAFDEVDFGVWEGLSFGEVRERYPEAFRLWFKDPITYPPPQGESFRKAQKRSMTRLRKIIAEHKGQQIAIVAHAGILRIMIFALLDMRLHSLFRIGQGYGCINIIDVYEDGVVVADLLNFTYYKVATEEQILDS
jgi:alpha-ribazole phosphatase/probable phosphoglycerate mutase